MIGLSTMKNEFTCDGMTRGTTAGTTVWIRQTGTNECMTMHCSACFVTHIVDEASSSLALAILAGANSPGRVHRPCRPCIFNYYDAGSRQLMPAQDNFCWPESIQ